MSEDKSLEEGTRRLLVERDDLRSTILDLERDLRKCRENWDRVERHLQVAILERSELAWALGLYFDGTNPFGLDEEAKGRFGRAMELARRLKLTT